MPWDSIVSRRPLSQRVEVIRRALLRAIVEAEEERTRQAYTRKPDSEDEADDWSTAEEFKA